MLVAANSTPTCVRLSSNSAWNAGAITAVP
jgi:hypothetical protein